jgi:hypothetical protein
MTASNTGGGLHSVESPRLTVFLETCLNVVLVSATNISCYLECSAAKPRAFSVMTEEGDVHPLVHSIGVI